MIDRIPFVCDFEAIESTILATGWNGGFGRIPVKIFHNPLEFCKTALIDESDIILYHSNIRKIGVKHSKVFAEIDPKNNAIFIKKSGDDIVIYVYDSSPEITIEYRYVLERYQPYYPESNQEFNNIWSTAQLLAYRYIHGFYPFQSKTYGKLLRLYHSIVNQYMADTYEEIHYGYFIKFLYREGFMSIVQLRNFDTEKPLLDSETIANVSMITDIPECYFHLDFVSKFC